MPWLSLTLQVDAAAAERFTQALLDAGAQSVSLENPQGTLQAVGALVGIDVDAGALVRHAARAAGLEGAPAFRTDQLEDQDWVLRSQAQFAPLEIGARLWIGPSWHAPPTDGRAVVRLDPGLAFGTGSHPTTRLVLRFLERELRGGEGVLDYGCGSGILAIAALKLGARRAVGVDIDPDAVATARDNARRNGVAGEFLEGGAPLTFIADVVIANILANPLMVLAPVLVSRCRQGGRIALSGILSDQRGEVAKCYSPWIAFAPPAEAEGWVCLSGVKL